MLPVATQKEWLKQRQQTYSIRTTLSEFHIGSYKKSTNNHPEKQADCNQINEAGNLLDEHCQIALTTTLYPPAMDSWTRLHMRENIILH